VLTGWFSEFAVLGQPVTLGVVPYGDGPARFAGATYDPTSFYRAAAVFDLHERLELTPPLLREVSRHQVGLLVDGISALGIDPALARVEPMPPERRAGFVAIRSPRAGALQRAMRARGVTTDFRGDIVRVGPAPYLSDGQLDEAVAHLGEAARAGEF
jgi:kynureninase